MRTFFHLEVKRIWCQISNKRRQSLEMAINSSMLNGHVNSLPLLHPISAYSKPQRYSPLIFNDFSRRSCENQNDMNFMNYGRKPNLWSPLVAPSFPTLDTLEGLRSLPLFLAHKKLFSEFFLHNFNKIKNFSGDQRSESLSLATCSLLLLSVNGNYWPFRFLLFGISQSHKNYVLSYNLHTT